MNDSCIVTLRLDERTKEMLEALEKKEKDIAAREDRPAKKKIRNHSSADFREVYGTD